MKTAAALSLVVLLLAGCGESGSSSKPAEIVNAPTDYLKTTTQSQQRAVKTVDLVALNKAVESFFVQEGRFPKALEELETRNYLRALPPAPVGMKFAYDTNNGVVTLEKE